MTEFEPNVNFNKQENNVSGVFPASDVESETFFYTVAAGSEGWSITLSKDSSDAFAPDAPFAGHAR